MSEKVEVSQQTIYGEVRPDEEVELMAIVEILTRHGIEPTENQIQNLLRRETPK